MHTFCWFYKVRIHLTWWKSQIPKPSGELQSTGRHSPFGKPDGGEHGSHTLSDVRMT
jgi:hypothetical protein